MEDQPHIKKLFYGKVNSDVNIRFVKEGDYIDAQNIYNGSAGDGEHNRVVKVKGNTNIPYTRPVGRCKVLKTLTDEISSSIFMWLWNENNDHRILRFTPSTGVVVDVLAAALLNWNEDTYIGGADLIDGKLLYWTDPIPRKINVNKGINDGKEREWNVYFTFDEDDPNINPVVYGYFNGSIAFSASYDRSIGQTFDDFIDEFNNEFANTGLVAESCKDRMVVRQTSPDNGWSVQGEYPDFGVNSIAIAQNFYPEILEETIYLGKYPFPCFPTLVLNNNSDVKYNYVKDRVFQFRVQLMYDDYERSALSQISDIDVRRCGNTYNYISVDFTIDRLNDPDRLALIDGVRILFREKNDGVWKIAEEIDQADLWKWSNEVGNNTYDFYNDGIYNAVDDALAIKPFDALPRTAKDQETFDNRIGLANCTSPSYDKTCTDAKIDVSFDRTSSPSTYNVIVGYRITCVQQFADPLTGGILITNRGSVGSIYKLSDEDGNYPIFGGAGSRGIVDYAGSENEQWLPEGGFVSYIAGTDRYAISRQFVDGSTSLNYDSANVINATTNSLKDDVERWYEDYESNPGGRGDMISFARITSVPSGAHVIRTASHWCSVGDVLDKGFMYNLNNGLSWQRTSTYVYGFNPADGSVGINDPYAFVREVTIEIDDNGNWEVSHPVLGIIKTGTTSSGGDIYIGDFYIDDLCRTQTTFLDSKPSGFKLQGYMIDSPQGNTQSGFKTANSMELQYPEMYIGSNLIVGGGGGSVGPAYIRYGHTDHNGFFYFQPQDATVYTQLGQNISGALLAVYSINGLVAKRFQDGYYNAGLRELYSGNAPIINESGVIGDNSSTPLPDINKALKQIIAFNTSPDVSAQNKTTIKGRVVDSNGNGISNSLVVYERNGRQERTDSNGDFSITVYGDRVDNNGRRIYDDLIVTSNESCRFTLPSGKFWEVYDIDIDPFGVGGYNELSLYEPLFLNDIIGTYLASSFIKLLKLGGFYRFGIVYFDEMNRQAPVERIDDIYIPFITEDVNDYYPNIPSQNSDGIFTLTLDLSNATPPTWAKKATVVRWKNSSYNNYLQFPVGDVKYVIAYDRENEEIIETTFGNQDGNLIYLGFEQSVNSYIDYNPDSKKTWTFTDGDRVRFIRNEENSIYDQFIDVPIKGVVDEYYVIDNFDTLGEIKSGTLVEVYTPKLQVEEQILYEVPVCIDIEDNEFVESSIVINTGDTYRRPRTVRVPGFGTISSYIEDRSVSDFLDLIVEDIGRPQVEDNADVQINESSNIYFSGKYIPDTQVNNLSTFEAGNYKQLPREYGEINRIITTNDDSYREVMLAICRNRTASIYIGEAIISDLEGDSFISIADQILGSVRLLKGDYGTTHPESVTSYNGKVYWWDHSRSAVVKYSLNGLMDLAKNGRTGHFKEKQRAYGSLPYKVVGGVDRYRDMVYMTFLATEQVVPTTDGYFDKDGGNSDGWVGTYQFTPEAYGSLDDNNYTFFLGTIWEQDTNPLYCNFFGIQYRAHIEFVLNDIRDSRAVFKWTMQKSRGPWWYERIEIPPNDSYPAGMESRLKSGNFKLIEGDYYGDLLRDMNDPAYQSQGVNVSLLKGRYLRGDIMIVKAVNDTTEYGYFDVAKFGFFLSEKTEA